MSLKNSNVETYCKHVMILEGEAFGRRLGHEGGSLTNRIRALVKETPERSLSSFAIGGYSEKTAIEEPRSQPSPYSKSADALILDVSSSRTVKNNCPLLISHPVCGIC